jgi:hypothetical protein
MSDQDTPEARRRPARSEYNKRDREKRRADPVLWERRKEQLRRADKNRTPDQRDQRKAAGRIRYAAWKAAHPEEAQAQQKRKSELRHLKGRTSEQTEAYLAQRRAKWAQMTPEQRKSINAKARGNASRRRVLGPPPPRPCLLCGDLQSVGLKFCSDCSSPKGRHLRRKYGISLKTYARMLESQGGRCKICRGAARGLLVVDHCHRLNVVRGLICRLCNSMIGLARDSPRLLRRAALYLEQVGLPLEGPNFSLP